MDGFTNLEETESQTQSRTGVVFKAVSFKTWVTVTWNNRTKLEKGLLVAFVALVVLAMGLIIGLAASSNKGGNQTQEPSSPEICLSDDCTIAASRVLESMDRSVNPCEDFYTYACGTWKKTHVIPEDSSDVGVFSVLQNKIQMINKNLYEDPNNYGVNETAWRKAKDIYASCMNTEQIEQKNLSYITPILEDLGGWPVLGTSPGGNWIQSDFDLVGLLVLLRQYNVLALMQFGPFQDLRNSKQRLLYFNQPDTGVPVNQEAYLSFAKSVAVLLGADPNQADTEMRDVLDFQISLTRILMGPEETKDPNNLYNKMTLSDLKRNFTEPASSDSIQFSWHDYIYDIMGLDGVNVKISDREPIVVAAVPYFQKLFGTLQRYSRRTITNYIIWSFMQESTLTLALPRRFKELQNNFNKESRGKGAALARWHECESYVTSEMGMVTTQKFVKQEFDESARQRAKEMIGHIRTAFNELLHEIDWMDKHTKSLAKEKAEAMKNWIGYPDDILDNNHINKLYEKVVANKNEFLMNILHSRNRLAIEGLRNLREPYNKTSEKEVWSLTPTTVNAFYNPLLNDIIILAGILHRPFYGKNQPKSMNYGAIGTVIGHEITHGFDDSGRRYNKDGDLKQWWEQKIIDNFKEHAKCMEDQYGGFVVPEVNMTINGKLTLGENIADNGGVKQSYRAYRSWVKEQGKEEPGLPGLSLTHDQLFFVSFSQNWCSNTNLQSAYISLLNDVHSPNQFRVIGTLQNSEEFAQAFNCPKNSYMNPDKKCSVW